MKASIALLVLTAAVSADVVVVEPGGPVGTLPTVQAGVDAAGEGDMVLVRSSSGFAQAVVIDGKSLQLVADTGFAPRVQQIVVRNVDAGQSVLVRGVDVGGAGAFPVGDGVLLESNAGPVRLEDLTAQGRGGSPGTLSSAPVDGAAGLSVVACNDVVAVECGFFAGGGGWLEDEDFEFSPSDGGAGVLVRSTTLALLDCVATGGPGGSVTDTTADSGGWGGDGVLNKTGTVFFSGGIATGGDGGDADCDFFAGSCGAGGRGGDGYHQEFASASVVFRGGDLSGGNAGVGGSGVPSLSGQATDLEAGTLDVLPAAPRGFDVTSPVREGDDATLTFSGLPGDTALLVLGFAPTQAFLPAYQGALLTTPPTIIPLGGVGVTPLQIVATIPDLPPGVDDVTLYIQAAYDDGASVLLGPARALTLLDAGF